MSEQNEHPIKVDKGGGRQESINMNLPSNAHKKKRVTVTDLKSAKNAEPQSETEVDKIEESRPKLEKIVENAARKKKRGFGTWLKETFTGEDAKSVARYVSSDVIIPAIKDLIADAGTQALQRIIFGDSSPRGRYDDRSRDRTHVPYNRMSISGGDRRDGRTISRRSRAVHDFDDIVLGSRREAEDVLYAMKQRVDEYGSATVTDLYDLVDISSNFTDDKWGWFDLHDTGVRRIRDGYVLVLPRPEVVE